MRRIGATAAIAAAVAACSMAGSGVAAATGGNFSGFGTDADRATAESYATNNAYASAPDTVTP